MANEYVGGEGGFEPPIRLPVCRISSAVHSTTLPPLQTIAMTAVFRFAARGNTADGHENGHQPFISRVRLSQVERPRRALPQHRPALCR